MKLDQRIIGIATPQLWNVATDKIANNRIMCYCNRFNMSEANLLSAVSKVEITE